MSVFSPVSVTRKKERRMLQIFEIPMILFLGTFGKNVCSMISSREVECDSKSKWHVGGRAKCTMETQESGVR